MEPMVTFQKPEISPTFINHCFRWIRIALLKFALQMCMLKIRHCWRIKGKMLGISPLANFRQVMIRDLVLLAHSEVITCAPALFSKNAPTCDKISYSHKVTKISQQFLVGQDDKSLEVVAKVLGLKLASFKVEACFRIYYLKRHHNNFC